MPLGHPSSARLEHVNPNKQAGEVSHGLSVDNRAADLANTDLESGATSLPFEMVHEPRCSRETFLAEETVERCTNMRPGAETLLYPVAREELPVALMAVEVFLLLVIEEEALIPTRPLPSVTLVRPVVRCLVQF